MFSGSLRGCWVRPVVFRREEDCVAFCTLVSDKLGLALTLLPIGYVLLDWDSGTDCTRFRLTEMEEESVSSQYRAYRVTTEPIRDMMGSGSPSYEEDTVPNVSWLMCCSFGEKGVICATAKKLNFYFL